jgi:hypothetical protein
MALLYGRSSLNGPKWRFPARADNSAYISLRQLCDHPAANAEWSALLQEGAQGDHHLHSIDDLRLRFV